MISPGVVDSAAHLAHAEHGGIGRTWEGFATGTQAAAAGGVTTVVDLPDLSPTLTSSAAALHQKTEAARGQLHADVGFWGAVTPDHARDRLGLRELLDAGALGLVALLGGGDEHADEAGGAEGGVEGAASVMAPSERTLERTCASVRANGALREGVTRTCFGIKLCFARSDLIRLQSTSALHPLAERRWP